MEWREHRVKAGLTLRALAAITGVSAPFLSDVEHGRRSMKPTTEKKLRAALGLPEKPPSGPSCVVCEGELSERVRVKVTGPVRYGPVSDGSYREYVDGYTCERCGLHYDQEPAE